MKRKLFLATLGLGLSSALFVANATQDQTQSPTRSSTSDKSSLDSSSLDKGAPGKGTSSISGQSQKFMKGSQLTTASIKSSSGETLGQINDLIVDPATGRIEFAVISPSSGAQPGKLTAIPWTLIRPSGEASTLTANIDKTKLSTAQTFDRYQWPDMSQESWAQQVYSHYGLQWQDRSSTGGRVPLGGSEAGTGVSPSKGTDIDNSTAPDGKGTLKNESNPTPSQDNSTQGNTIPGKKDSGLK
jgi:sporulation protein YlmC with PRC-barrel domain